MESDTSSFFLANIFLFPLKFPPFFLRSKELDMSSSTAPYNPDAPSFVESSIACDRIPPIWKQADLIACASVGQIQSNGWSLGSGVLIGIDRVLVPAHVLAGVRSDSLQVVFHSHSHYQRYWILTFFFDEALDLAILQLDRSVGQFPGETRDFPYLSTKVPPNGEFLLGSFDEQSPSSRIYESGHLRYSNNFGSFIPTEEGCCGSGYFNEEGHLFALHLSRSNDFCAGAPKEEQKVILVSQMLDSPQLGWIFECYRGSPLINPRMLPNICVADAYYEKTCFIEEEQPETTKEIQIFGRTHEYWEYRPNYLKDSRGLTICMPHQRQKLTYVLNLQSHDLKAYKEEANCLYIEAAKTFKIAFETMRKIPEMLVFQAYSNSFVATKVQVESFIPA